jgi:actin-related protein
MSGAEKLPRTERPLTIVLAGGSAKPKGFKDLFERSLKSRAMPIEIAEVRMARDPLTATARGALIAAMYEK